jgi:hypothetical protein
VGKYLIFHTKYAKVIVSILTKKKGVIYRYVPDVESKEVLKTNTRVVGNYRVIGNY